MQVRRLPLATLALAGALALGGCGSSGDGGVGRLVRTGPSTSSHGAAKVLTPAQAADAVISLDDLGSGFQVDPDKSNHDDTDLGCLADLDKVTKPQHGGAGPEKPATKHDAQYKAATQAGMPFVMSSVDSMRSAGGIQRELSLVAKALRSCHTVDTTDGSGLHARLTITTDRKLSTGADDQVNMTAAGQMSLPAPTGQTITVPFYMRISLARVGNDVALIGYGSMVEPAEGTEDAQGLITFAVARLRAVASGTAVPTAPDFGLRRITTADVLKGLSSGGGTV